MLAKLLAFSGMLNTFRNVTRVLRVNGEDRWENDVEHSYQLAMLGWYFIESHGFSLDAHKVLKYALVHDFVEVHAGDTYIYSTDDVHKNSKHARERDAAVRLRKEIPEFGELHELIEAYEQRADRESRFVYALDKIQPLLNVYLDEGRTWKEGGITLAMLEEYTRDKVRCDPDVAACFAELHALLKEREGELFCN